MNGRRGRFDRPWTDFAPAGTVLRRGTPSGAGLDPRPIADALAAVARGTEPGPDGIARYAGAVALLVHDGVVVAENAAGHALRHADATGTELPAAHRIPARTDTVFDLASVTKLATALAVLREVERGRLDLTEPIGRYLPAAGRAVRAITIERLLTHTSGLPPEPVPPLWRLPDVTAREAAVLATTPDDPPGTGYRYSDINLLLLGLAVARVAGAPLDSVVRNGITAPLGLADTGFRPAADIRRIAATEFQHTPPRGLVHGTVHDESAWALGGVAGHAGLFGTAADLAVLGQTLLDGGSYAGARILRPDTVRLFLADHGTRLGGEPHGLGIELGRRWYADALTAPRTAGHTGFTGTSLVLDPASRSLAILLTNRVHPHRTGESINPDRRALARGLARALTIHPDRAGPWFTATGDDESSTLGLVAGEARAGGTVHGAVFVDTAEQDGLTLESTSDGQWWRPVPLRATGSGAPACPVTRLGGAGHRAWWRVASAPLPAGTTGLRWRYAVTGPDRGRGVAVAELHLRQPGGTAPQPVDPDQVTAVGWRRHQR